LIGGLWHGASWTFVAWGAYHGLLLAGYRRIAGTWDALPTWVRRPSMWIVAVGGWGIFRAQSFGVAPSILSKMFSPAAGSLVPNASLAVFALSVAAIWATAGPNAFDMKHERSFRMELTLATAVGACVAIIAGSRSSPFLYFQF